MAAKRTTGNTTGSLTLALHSGDSVSIAVPGSEPILVYLARVETDTRVSLNIRAPRDYRIDRIPGGAVVVDKRKRK